MMLSGSLIVFIVCFLAVGAGAAWLVFSIINLLYREKKVYLLIKFEMHSFCLFVLFTLAEPVYYYSFYTTFFL
jgi:hypothetical protein